tara:strand:- start:639 stop:1589 length:951 start_codon:yes stop_codon:yes gene_type:complete
MNDYYSEQTVEAVTKKYHWVNGLDEYLTRINSPHLDKFTALRNAIFYGNPYKVKELLLDEINRGNTGLSEEFVNILMHGHIDWTKWITHKKLINYFAHCIPETLFSTINAWSDRYGGDVVNINDHFSRGQIQSKMWMLDELENIVENKQMGNVLMYGGWYNTFAYFLFERFDVDKIFSLDVDPNVWEIADNFNAHQCYKENWRFKAATVDVDALGWNNRTVQFDVDRPQLSPTKVKFQPNIVINTSCEHMTDAWFDNLPEGMPVCLQTNNYFENEQHTNCVRSVAEAKVKYRFRDLVYAGELETYLYTRYTLIGIK